MRNLIVSQPGFKPQVGFLFGRRFIMPDDHQYPELERGLTKVKDDVAGVKTTLKNVQTGVTNLGSAVDGVAVNVTNLGTQLIQLNRSMGRRFWVTWLVLGATSVSLAIHLWTASVPTSPEGVATELASLHIRLAAIDEQTKRTEVNLRNLTVFTGELVRQSIISVAADQVILDLIGELELRLRELEQRGRQPSPPRPSPIDDYKKRLALLGTSFSLPIKEKLRGVTLRADGSLGFEGEFDKEKVIPVYAMRGGQVLLIRPEDANHKQIEIGHEPGPRKAFGYRTRYGRLTEVKATEGQMVERGELIGIVRAASKVCLTAAIIPPGSDKPVDPRPFLGPFPVPLTIIPK